MGAMDIEPVGIAASWLPALSTHTHKHTRVRLHNCISSFMCKQMNKMLLGIAATELPVQNELYLYNVSGNTYPFMVDLLQQPWWRQKNCNQRLSNKTETQGGLQQPLGQAPVQAHGFQNKHRSSCLIINASQCPAQWQEGGNESGLPQCHLGCALR